MEKDLDRFHGRDADPGDLNDPAGDPNLFDGDLGLGADFFNDQDVLPNNFDLPQAPSQLADQLGPQRPAAGDDEAGLQGTVAEDLERLAREGVADDTINHRDGNSIQALLPGEQSLGQPRGMDVSMSPSQAPRRVPATQYLDPYQTADDRGMPGLTPGPSSSKKLMMSSLSPAARSQSSTFKVKKEKKKVERPRQHSVVSQPRMLNPEADAADVEKFMQAAGQKNKDKEELEAYNAKHLKRLVGTQTVIDRAVALLDTDPWDDLGNWPADATAYKGMRLSEQKMKNEVDHREPRTSAFDGRLGEYSLIGADTGVHSTDRRARKSDIEELGEGTNLYFKFLKYWMLLFFIATCLSGPALAIFAYGMEYDQVAEPFVKWLSVASLGNMGSYQAHTCASAPLPATKNAASYIGFRCEHGKKLKSLQHFGLAYKNDTCVGLGFQKSVKTIDRCTMGSMSDLQVDYNLQTMFDASCVGQTVCSVFLDYSAVFTSECRHEIALRQLNRSDYGPAKVYAVAQCEAETLRLGSIAFDLPWDSISITIVSLDCLIMFILTVGIFKLRWYEQASTEDLKQGKTRVDDFTVTLPDIPLAREDYSNKPELLTAMIAVHLEEIVGHELQCIKELEEIQMHQTHILDINYGLSSQTSMGYLVHIWDECEKIADLKKKIQVDPAATRTYEAEIWRAYSNISYHNDLYYEDKEGVDPAIMNAYVTFRSMEGKQRAIKAYDISPFLRTCLSFCCCLDKFFKKKMLIQKGMPTVNDAVDPNIITWENLGISFARKCAFRSITAFLLLAALGVSFGGQIYFSNLEKDYDTLIRSDCTGEAVYDIDKAWLDIKKTNVKERLGIMNCYCRQQYDTYGDAALKLVFADGAQYCKDWHFVYGQARVTAPALGAWIAIMNVVLTLISTCLGKFKRGKDVSEGYRHVIFNIFLSQYINTALIVLVAQNSFLWSEERRSSLDKSLILVGVFDEFNAQWYLRIGTALIFAQGAMIVFPHISTILESVGLCCLRLLDRRCTCNTKNTSKIIQSEYEDLYTGPEFILEVRYGQVLATIFVTITFSSGMPGLYAVNFVVLFVQYWVDKWLIFNYYKKTPQFTRQVSKAVVDLLPFAIVIHLLFGFMTYSYPYALKSTVAQGWFGNESQYFNPQRLGQTHMIVFFVYACVNLILFLFEDFFVDNWSACSGYCGVQCALCCSKCQGKTYDEVDFSTEGFVYSDDFLYEVNFGELYRLYCKTQDEKRRYKQMREKSEVEGGFSPLELKLYIDPYLRLLERNYKDLRAQILELVDLHEDRLPVGDLDVDLMADEEKIAALFELFTRGTDKDNAERPKYEKMLDPRMRGRIMNDIQSYHFLENEKYRRIQQLLQIMNETFGFDEAPEATTPKKAHIGTPDRSRATDDGRLDSGETGRGGVLELAERAEAAGTRDSQRKPATRSDFGFSRGGASAQRDPQKINNMKMNMV